MTSRRSTCIAASLLAACLLACGGDDAPAPPPANAPTARTGGATPAAPAPTAPARTAATPARSGSNLPPVVRSVKIEPAQPASGDTVKAVVQTEDPDGDPVVVQYQWRIKGRSAGGNEPRLLLLGASKSDTVEVLVTPSDGQSEGPPVRATARVRNRAPSLDAVHIEPAGTITGADDIVVRPQARDVDGDPITFTYRWTVNGETVDERGSVLETERLKRGDVVRVRVTASDGDDRSGTIETPDLKIANGVPRIVSEPGLPTEGGGFVYAVKAEDPDGDRLRFVLDEAPPGMQIDPLSGEITWRPAEDATGEFAVRIRVEDMHGGEASQVFRLTLSQEDQSPEAPASPGG